LAKIYTEPSVLSEEKAKIDLFKVPAPVLSRLLEMIPSIHCKVKSIPEPLNVRLDANFFQPEHLIELGQTYQFQFNIISTNKFNFEIEKNKEYIKIEHDGGSFFSTTALVKVTLTVQEDTQDDFLQEIILVRIQPWIPNPFQSSREWFYYPVLVDIKIKKPPFYIPIRRVKQALEEGEEIARSQYPIYKCPWMGMQTVAIKQIEKSEFFNKDCVEREKKNSHINITS